MPTDRIAELRALIAASQAAHDACRTRSDVPLRERLAIRDDAAAAMYAAMERDMPALLDCAEALQRAQRLIREALPKFNWSASCLDANAIGLLNEVPGEVDKALARAALANGEEA